MAKGEWNDITPPERLRMYVYPNDEMLRLTNVTRVKVSESGNHYVESDEGKCIVAPGWRWISLDIDAWTF